MGYTRETELRKISPAELNKIALTLNIQSAWKKLMEYVPLRLTDAAHWEDGTSRYKIDDIGLIENTRTIKSPSEIFLEEWATSGSIRPTLGHLLQFLVNIELFRAADYVAMLLNEPPPTRPKRGPAARVDIDLAALLEINSISEELHRMDYPNSSQLMNTISGPDNNKDYFIKQNLDRVAKLDDISITGIDTGDIPSTSAERSQIPSQQNQPSTSADQNPIVSTFSELNHHSTSERWNSSAFLPNLNELISTQTNQLDQNLPSTSRLQSDSSTSSNLPRFSQLNIDEFSANIPQLSELVFQPTTD